MSRSRGKKRTSRAKRRERHTAKLRAQASARLAEELQPSPGESIASAAYTAGRTVGYRYRIAGPTFPIVVTHKNDHDT